MQLFTDAVHRLPRASDRIRKRSDSSTLRLSASRSESHAAFGSGLFCKSRVASYQYRAPATSLHPTSLGTRPIFVSYPCSKKWRDVGEQTPVQLVPRSHAMDAFQIRPGCLRERRWTNTFRRMLNLIASLPTIRLFPPAIATFWLDSAQRRANPEHLFGAEMTFRIGHPVFDVPLNVFSGCQTASVCNDLQ